jgi:PAS domain S-box-containing protein
MMSPPRDLPSNLTEVWSARKEATLLWVSRDAETRRSLREAFATTSVSVVEADENEDIVVLFQSLLPDVVLLDYRPGPFDGAEACARIQELRGLDWRPVVGIVAEDDDDAFVRGVLAGFDDLVSRPIHAVTLNRRVALLLHERQARQSLLLLSEGAAVAPIGIAILDARSPVQAVAYVNQAYEHLSGCRAGDVVGRPLPGGAVGGPLAEAVEAGAGGRRYHRAVQVSRRDGTAYWADVTATPLLDSGGSVAHLVVTQCDVTAHLHALSSERDHESLEQRVAQKTGELEAVRQSLDERRRFTGTLLDQITASIITADGACRISFANRMALETLCRTPESCLGHDVLDVFGGSDELLRALREVADGGERRIEFALSRGDGRRLEVGMTIVRATHGAPADMSFVLVFRDLADRRQFEMELRRVERLSAIGNMVAGFAHEVRNPLAGIQALAEALLAETAKGDPRREYASRTLSLLQRVERFVKASLQFGEPKAAVRRRQAPQVLVATALEALAPRWGRRGTAPSVELSTDLPAVNADASQILECLLALLENALDAAGDPARVRVRVTAQDGEGLIDGVRHVVRFDVCDDGPGIPDGQLSRIFDPFFTTKPKGTGLGLSVAQTLVRENGGRLVVRSAPGGETVFSLVLPEASK